MRIVICGSVALPVPPPMQGGTERIAYTQAVELAKRGHDVILIAAYGSKKDPNYKLVEIGGGDTVTGSTHGQNLDKNKRIITESSRKLRKEAVYLTEVSSWLEEHKNDYDVILNNMRGGEAIFLNAARAAKKPFTSVMHLPIFDELADLFRKYHAYIITISNAQRAGYPDLNYAGTAYNALDCSEFTFSPNRGKYLLMMGSVVSHKNQKAGIEVSKKTGIPLIIAGKIGDENYFKKEIEPFIDNHQVIYKGEMGFDDKIALLKDADALLFPIIWQEPFGLVMIEAMACGTPVVAYRNGAIPEVVENEKTGYIVDEENGVDKMVEALKNIHKINRQECRDRVVSMFSVAKMIDAYEESLKFAIEKYKGGNYV